MVLHAPPRHPALTRYLIRPARGSASHPFRRLFSRVPLLTTCVVVAAFTGWSQASPSLIRFMGHAAHCTTVSVSNGFARVVTLPGSRPLRWTASVQVSTRGRTQTIFGPFSLYDEWQVDVSPHLNWIAYSDWSSRVHLVNLDTCRSQVLGTGAMPQFSFDGRYLAFLRPRRLGDSIEVFDTIRRRLAEVPPSNATDGPYSWAHRSDRLAFEFLTGGALRSHRHPRWLAVASMSGRWRVHRLWIPSRGGYSAATWSWDDRSLVYWSWPPSYPVRRLGLTELAVSGGGHLVLGSTRACKCEYIPAPVASGRQTLWPQTSEGQFLLALRRGSSRAVQFHEHPSATPTVLSVNPLTGTALIAWQAQGPRGFLHGVAVWHRGAGSARSVGRGVAAFWVHGGP